MKKIFLSFLFAAASWLAMEAMSIATAPGELQRSIGDKAVSQLVVTGSLDVRDFAFIADSLTCLSSLNLSGAEIAAYSCSGNECYFGHRGRFEAGVLPRYAFFGSRLHSLVLPAGLRVVGEAAVAACEELEDIAIPETVMEIGDYAFSASRLKCIALGSRVIGDGAFAGCTSLVSVAIGNAVREIGNRAFAGCEALATVDVAAGSELATIGDEAFSGTALTHFNFALCPSMEKVGKWAFAGTKIASISFPRNLSEIPEGVCFGNQAAVSVALPECAEEVGNYAFYGNSMAGNALSIPANVAYIGDNAFEDAHPALVKALPLAVPELGKEVFRGMNEDSSTPLFVAKEMIEAYKNAGQWCDFDIKDISGTIAPSVDNEVAVKISITGSVLQIIATDNITCANIFDEAGLLCAAIRDTGCEASTSIAHITSPVMIVDVTLRNGATRKLKILKH